MACLPCDELFKQFLPSYLAGAVLRRGGGIVHRIGLRLGREIGRRVHEIVQKGVLFISSRVGCGRLGRVWQRDVGRRG